MTIGRPNARQRPPLGTLALLLASLIAGSAVAQDAVPPDRVPQDAVPPEEEAATARARSLFLDGLAFADHGDWERAAHRFREALELRESANIRFNLAQSLVHRGRLVEALEEIERVLADESAAADVRQSAGALRGSLEPRLGRLIVEVRGDSEGTQVLVDGRPLPPERVGLPVPADPGIRIARLLRGAIELDVEEVDVPRGHEARVVVEVPALTALAPGQSGWDEGWSWAIAIGSVVVLAAAGVGIGFAVAHETQGTSMGDFGPPVLEID